MPVFHTTFSQIGNNDKLHYASNNASNISSVRIAEFSKAKSAKSINPQPTVNQVSRVVRAPDSNK